MATTRTGQFPIGFRRLGSDWQTELDDVIQFAKDNQFQCVDVGALGQGELKKITDAGLQIGTVDLLSWSDLASADAKKRQDAASANAEMIRSATAVGARNFFVVIIPEDHAAPRKVNLDRAVNGFGQLCALVSETGAKIVIEGWPGPGPYVPALACTPEGCRALFKEIGSDVMAINFDPSHLIRTGIDSVRFAGEFASRIAHVHAKDTEILDDVLYEYGTEQPATLGSVHGFGAFHWRYTIPGHGVARWTKLFSILQDAGYDGLVSIELEDENFFSSAQDQKRGFIAARDFLVHA